MKIKYIKGDATKPVGEGLKFIIHCCNDIGAWGAGFVLALSKKWKEPEIQYRDWFNNNELPRPKLGNIQLVSVSKNITVVNMIGQHTTFSINGVPPIRYEAIEQCLNRIITIKKHMDFSVHAPKFGSDLAGGDWNKIEHIINNTLIMNDIDVTIYEWEG